MPDGSTPEMAARANTLSSMRAAMLIFLFLGMEPSSLKILLPFEVAARIITYKIKHLKVAMIVSVNNDKLGLHCSYALGNFLWRKASIGMTARNDHLW